MKYENIRSEASKQSLWEQWCRSAQEWSEMSYGGHKSVVTPEQVGWNMISDTYKEIVGIRPGFNADMTKDELMDWYIDLYLEVQEKCEQERLEAEQAKQDEIDHQRITVEVLAPKNGGFSIGELVSL